MTRCACPALMVLLSLAIALLAGCSDDGSENTSADTGQDVVADSGTADTGAGNGDSSASDTPTQDAGTDPGADEPVERSACDNPPAQDEAATYDLASQLQMFVGDGTVTRTGNTVSVLIVDQDGDETTFEGEFEGGGNCILVDDEALSADLCFFNADATAAEPQSLGANIYGFFRGAPRDILTSTLVAALRRDVDRSCSPGGFYVTDAGELAATSGNLTPEVVEATIDFYTGYFMILESGQGGFAIVLGDEPIEERLLDGDPLGGEIEAAFGTGFEADLAAGAVELDVDVSLAGTLDLALGDFGGTLTITLEVDDGEGMSGTIEGILRAERN